jgi:hypothetical protein
MVFMFPPPTIKDVLAALEPLKDIERPEGDNEGEAINSPDVYNSLSSKDRSLVDHAEEVAREYMRKPGHEGLEPNKRAITELNKKGYSAALNVDQYDPYKLVGRVDIGDWRLDVSDQGTEHEDD